MSLAHPVAAGPDHETEVPGGSRGQHLDSPQAHIDALCRTARRLFSVPTAAITFTGNHWGVGAYGCRTMFCDPALLGDDVLVVEDTARDPRFRDDPLVTGEPRIRFYAGAPLIAGPGVRVGTLCIMDIVPRALSAEQAAALADLATIAVATCKSEDSGDSCANQAGPLREAHDLLSLVEELAQIGHWRIDTDTGQIRSSAGFEAMFGRGTTEGRLNLDAHMATIHPDDRDRTRRKIQQCRGRDRCL